MAACEKCWRDAYTDSRETGRSQADCYHDILQERKDNPCSPEEQKWGRNPVLKPTDKDGA